MACLWPLSESSGCISRNFGYDSVVCECNSTYCDSVGPAALPPVGQFSSYLTSRDGRRLEASWGHVQVNGSATGECRPDGLWQMQPKTAT